jgi:hypothetical protein
MPLQIFFNDLSSQNAPAGHPAAVTRLRTLVQVVRAARREFGDVVFNAQDRLDDLDLGGETYLAGLRNAADCREEAAFLKTVTDRSPLGLSMAELEGPVDEEFEYRLEAAAFVLPGEVAVAWIRTSSGGRTRSRSIEAGWTMQPHCKSTRRRRSTPARTSS